MTRRPRRDLRLRLLHLRRVLFTVPTTTSASSSTALYTLVQDSDQNTSSKKGPKGPSVKGRLPWVVGGILFHLRLRVQARRTLHTH